MSTLHGLFINGVLFAIIIGIVIGCYGLAFVLPVAVIKAVILGAMEHLRGTGFYKRYVGEDTK